MNCMSESCALKKSLPSSIATTPRMMIEGRSTLDSPDDTDNDGRSFSWDDEQISSTSVTMFEPNKKMNVARLDVYDIVNDDGQTHEQNDNHEHDDCQNILFSA